MKYYRVFEPDEIEKVYSEEDILKMSWSFWSKAMAKKFGDNHPEITKDNCIKDWVIVHWAKEIGDY